MRRPSHGVLTFLVALCAGAGIAAPEDFDRIEVRSSWKGMIPARNQQAALVLTRVDGGFASGELRVPEAKAAALLEALEAPRVDAPSLEPCGLTPAWLEAHAREALEGARSMAHGAPSARQQELFRSRLIDPASAEEAFRGLFRSVTYDDYPTVTVTVSGRGGARSVQSRSTWPFMLPWVSGAQPTESYDCALSLALARVLPADFLGRERLVPGPGLVRGLGEHVVWAIGPRWGLLEAEARLGDQLAPILEQHTVVKSDLADLSSVDVEGGTSWNATLKSPSLPENLELGVSLPVVRTCEAGRFRLPGAQAFVSTYRSYASLVVGSSWFMDRLRRVPGATAEVRYVDGRSLSHKAEASAAEDLKEQGRAWLAERLHREAGGCAFVEVDERAPGVYSRWIVFPDGTVMLWMFQGETVLGLAGRALESWQKHGWRGSGQLVLPDGGFQER